MFSKPNQRANSKSSRAEKKVNRETIQEEFWNEVDSGKFNQFAEEESFQTFLYSVKNQAMFIRKYATTSGPNNLQFKVHFPLEHFCACVSQLQFNRITDVSFRYVTHFHTVLFTLLLLKY
jgi:hypothetical protein